MRTAIPSEADYNRIMPIIMYRTGLTLHSSFGMCDVFDEKGSAIAAAQWEPAKMTCMGGLRMLGVFPRMWWALGWGKGLIMVKLMLKLEKKRHAHAPTANHLMTLGTHSGHQGKGVGSKLIKRGIERATEAGCPCYLESRWVWGTKRSDERSGSQEGVFMAMSEATSRRLSVIAVVTDEACRVRKH